MNTDRSQDSGFTLLEALVAMTVLAVAAAGLVGAASAHVDRIRDIELRAQASWLAEERLTGLRLGLRATERAEFTGHSWLVHQDIYPTDDPAIARAEIAVTLEGQKTSLARLSGFFPTSSSP